jgi:hypothetical protein
MVHETHPKARAWMQDEISLVILLPLAVSAGLSIAPVPFSIIDAFDQLLDVETVEAPAASIVATSSSVSGPMTRGYKLATNRSNLKRKRKKNR